MADVIKTYKESVPAMRFIGKKYTDEDRVDGSFGAKWGEWFENNLFEALEKLGSPDGLDNGHIGYMTCDENDKFNYWIGRFTPANTTVPDGFGFLDFPVGELAVCHVYGKEPDIYCKEGMCCDKLKADGFDFDDNSCFERYNCPRFTTPDGDGNVILDICFFMK